MSRSRRSHARCGRSAAFDVLEAEASPAGAAVREVIAQVRSRGDAALCEYGKRFDKADLTAEQLRVPAERLEPAASNLDPASQAGDPKAIDNVRGYQEQILQAADRTCERPGIRLELRFGRSSAWACMCPPAARRCPAR